MICPSFTLIQCNGFSPPIVIHHPPSPLVQFVLLNFNAKLYDKEICGNLLCDGEPSFKEEEAGLEEKGRLTTQNHEEVEPVPEMDDIEDPVRATEIGNFIPYLPEKSDGPGFYGEVPFKIPRPTMTKWLIWVKEKHTRQEILLLPRIMSFNLQVIAASISSLFRMCSGIATMLPTNTYTFMSILQRQCIRRC
jgi:hypothetical protein